MTELKDKLKEAACRVGSNGYFIVSGDKEPNIMTAGWGSVGFFWGKPIISIPVRHSRYTHDCLESVDTFTVNIAKEGSMKDELIFCGTKSGRDVNKADALGLTYVPSKSVGAPVIRECEIHIECKIVGKTEIIESGLSDEINKKWYGDNDYHTLYFGEIIECY